MSTYSRTQIFVSCDWVGLTVSGNTMVCTRIFTTNKSEETEARDSARAMGWTSMDSDLGGVLDYCPEHS